MLACRQRIFSTLPCRILAFFAYICGMKAIDEEKQLPDALPESASSENASTQEVKPENSPASQAASDSDEEMRVTERTIEMLRTVFDPEIPVNVYDLGLIYKIDYEVATKTLHVDMTLTAPGCPAADFIMEDVRQKLLSVEGPEKIDLQLVFEPVWTQDMMSEEAKLELGFL